MLKEKAVSIIQAKASGRSSRRPLANRFLVDFWRFKRWNGENRPDGMGSKVSMRERRAAGPHTSLRSQAVKDRDAIEATEEWGCSRGVCASDGRDRAPRRPPCGGWGTRRPPLSLHLPSPMTHRVCHFPLRVPRPADDSATTATFGDTFHLQTSGETVGVAVIDSAFSAWAVTVHILLCAG